MTPEEKTRVALEHHQRGRLAEAEKLYREIVDAAPENAMAWNLLGALLGQTGRKAEAVAACRKAVRLKGDFVEALYNLANALAETGDWDGAEEHCRAALRLRPNLGPAHFTLGVALQEKGRVDEAVAAYREALRLMPGHVKAQNNLGLALAAQKKWDEALRMFQAVLRVKADFGEAHLNLGAALEKTGRTEEAIGEYENALRLMPENRDAWSNLCNALTNTGRIVEALAAYRAALEALPRDARLRSGYLFALNYAEGTGAEHLAGARRFDELHAAGLTAGAREHENVREARRRIRAGYVSADLGRHPVAQFLRPILAHHDKEQVEVFVYSNSDHEDEITRALQALVPHWRAVAGLDDAQLEQQIRADGIDILVDLSGHSVGNRLLTFARRPAPVQIAYLGYCATTGLRAMDYCLTDGLLDAAEDEGLYTEKLLRLPGCFCCYWMPREEREFVLEAQMSGALPVAAAPAARSGFITFGSFHALKKLNDGVLDLWARVLLATPGSRLLVYRHTLRGQEQERLRRRLAERGIGAGRVEMEDAWPAGRHYLARYDQIDIHLDTFPWSGHTTTCEALWMGVPTITLLGDRHAGRMSATVLRAAELGDFVAHSAEEFVAIGQSWNGRIAELAELRRGMRGRMERSALCDGAAFTRGLEEAYREVWRKWCGSRA